MQYAYTKYTSTNKTKIHKYCDTKIEAHKNETITQHENISKMQGTKIQQMYNNLKNHKNTRIQNAANATIQIYKNAKYETNTKYYKNSNIIHTRITRTCAQNTRNTKSTYKEIPKYTTIVAQNKNTQYTKIRNCRSVVYINQLLGLKECNNSQIVPVTHNNLKLLILPNVLKLYILNILILIYKSYQKLNIQT